jgi:DNA-directed RNA polymerase specialized sigma54-like protein
MTLAALKTLADFFTKNTVDQIKILIKPNDSFPESSMVYAANAMTSNSQPHETPHDNMITSNHNKIATSDYYNKPQPEYNNAAPPINDIHDLTNHIKRQLTQKFTNKITNEFKHKTLDHLTKHGFLDKTYAEKLRNIKTMDDVKHFANTAMDEGMDKGIDNIFNHGIKALDTHANSIQKKHF